jgi:cell division protein FtsB
MEFHLLFEILKALLMLVGIARYYFQQKREKALLATLDSYKQRLENLESEFKKLKS